MVSEGPQNAYFQITHSWKPIYSSLREWAKIFLSVEVETLDQWSQFIAQYLQSRSKEKGSSPKNWGQTVQIAAREAKPTSDAQDSKGLLSARRLIPRTVVEIDLKGTP